MAQNLALGKGAFLGTRVISVAFYVGCTTLERRELERSGLLMPLEASPTNLNMSTQGEQFPDALQVERPI